ncbi:N-acetylmuramoyl-L-alanine amidase [Terrilactibacillus sp. BCM23-1]|uniref:N-acetylmuramoyl-L-alanine amidase n=2 Tax=Terrilactibacillus tamarindi TaxID=2599694 RepID=A0A6N8CS80_9BACI|nr:N-acetylmuramoyl-L-alanine amidase [Terrilactibacillus tamarindi]
MNVSVNKVSAKEAGNQNSLQASFVKASKEYHVPLSILMSVAYNETRWEQHGGEPSTSGGYGVMHLTQVNRLPAEDAKGDGNQPSSDKSTEKYLHTLDKAATLLGAQTNDLKKDPDLNIRGGAAILAEYEKQTYGKISDNPADWYGAIAMYSESDNELTATGFADQVYATIQKGVEKNTSGGEHLKLTSEDIKPNKKTANSLQLKKTKETNVDCPNGVDCQFIPALYQAFSSSPGDYGNYDLANRPYDGLNIRYIVIHDIEGSYEAGINTFLRPSYVSAHYVVRSSDGQITEMVRPKDVAWQAGNWYINSHSIGIEHEGYAVEGASWYSEPMYQQSAKLVKYLAKAYNIPLDRQHILGHDNVPGLDTKHQRAMHWDPAAYWDWSHYFELLGAPFTSNSVAVDKSSDNQKNKQIVTINPNFNNNLPTLTYNNQPLEARPSDFVYLYSEPSFQAPLLGDPLIHPTGAGTTEIQDWGDKAVSGQTFYQVDKDGDWTAINYGGQKAWFYNPQGKNSTKGKGLIITPKEGMTSIPVYGSAYPEAGAFQSLGDPIVSNKTIYTMPAGQKYIGTGPVQSDYYFAKLFNQPSTYHVVKGNDEYYQITYNHRIAFVKKSDVDILK